VRLLESKIFKFRHGIELLAKIKRQVTVLADAPICKFDFF
jgi:hypothetical protein